MTLLASNPESLVLPLLILVGLGCCLSIATGLGLIHSAQTASRVRRESRDGPTIVGILLILLGVVPVLFGGLAWILSLGK